jgi:hypothetical protein
MHLSIVQAHEENPRDRGPLWLAHRKAFPVDLPDGLKPRLRLFLSVDLVGSTQAKQSHQSWRPAIINFYREFDHAVRAQFAGFNRGRNRIVPAPEFWKSNGDELLYTCELVNLEQAYHTLQEWLGALHEYRAHIAKGQLDVKSTGWIGLFPIPNAEVFFRRGDDRAPTGGPDDAALLQSELRDQWHSGQNRHEITRDFVGPSIDTGFRLTAWARPQRFIMSVDLAFLLTSSSDAVTEPLPLHFSGRETLKGVIDNEPYPTIWLPVGGQKADASVGRDLADPKALRAHCEVIIEQNYRFITPLFLGDSDYDDFDWAPPYIINEVRNLWRDEKRERAQRAARANDKDGTTLTSSGVA